MRNFQTLDTVNVDAGSGITYLTVQQNTDLHPQLAVRREGDHVAMSASYGPVEIALRPRYQEVAWALTHLVALDGMQTTLQVGSGQAYLAVGLNTDGCLLLRPSIAGDAAGHLRINLALTPEARKALYEALSIELK